MRTYKKIITLITTITLLISSILTTASASTLHTFKSNYDADKYISTQINFQTPCAIPQDWYPLKAVSAYLPIEVNWDNKTREVVIDNFPLQKMNPNIQGYRYKTNKLPDSLKIKNGVTYCSPNLLSYLLHGVGFRYNDEVYFFDGENVQSNLIKSGASKFFKDSVITSMYQLKLKAPNEYDMLRDCLSGGIQYVNKNNASVDYVGYVYPNIKNPVCYIVKDRYIGANLASLIAHEGYHVWQYRNGLDVDEDDAKEYERMIENLLNSMN